MHIPIGAGGYDLSWIEAVGTVAGLLCIWLASTEDCQLCLWADQRHAVCHYLLSDPALRQPSAADLFFAANVYGWYARSRQTSDNRAELQIRWLPLPKALGWLAACVVAIGLMTVFIDPVLRF